MHYTWPVWLKSLLIHWCRFLKVISVLWTFLFHFCIDGNSFHLSLQQDLPNKDICMYSSVLIPAQERQLQSHSGMLESFRADLSHLQKNPPEGKKAKAKDLEEHRTRAEYLHHEVVKVPWMNPSEYKCENTSRDCVSRKSPSDLPLWDLHPGAGGLEECEEDGHQPFECRRPQPVWQSGLRRLHRGRWGRGRSEKVSLQPSSRAGGASFKCGQSQAQHIGETDLSQAHHSTNEQRSLRFPCGILILCTFKIEYEPQVMWLQKSGPNLFYCIVLELDSWRTQHFKSQGNV